MIRSVFFSILLLLTTKLAFSQDTTSVYFKVGSHKLSAHSQKILEKTFHEIDYTDLAAITFIGYADSAGKSDSNQKLSEKRAKTVSKFGERFLDRTIPFSIQSKGELSRIVDSLSRRVDIVFHYQPDLERNKDTLVIMPEDPRCFFIDQDMEGYSYATVKVNKKKQVVYLQVLNEKEFTSRKYYYVKNPSTQGAVAQRVNFKLETTGVLWWREKRLTATIPKDSYAKYGLFYLENPPCEGCREQLFKKDTNVFSGTSIRSDFFTMSVTQLKTKLFRPNILKIRVPEEYIHENETYYVMKRYWNGVSGSDRERLKWEEKRGKRRENYLYAKTNIKKVEYVTIATPQRISYCPKKGGGLGTAGGGWIGCGGIGGGGMGGEFYLTPGIHAFYHNDTATAFVSANLEYHLDQHQLALSLGLNHRLGLYYSANYHYEIFSFNMMRNRLLDPWQSLKNTRFTSQVGVYTGAEFRSSYTKNYRSFSEVNIHAGFSVDWPGGLGYYIHGGVARDLSNRINTGFYPHIQAGIRFRFEL